MTVIRHLIAVASVDPTAPGPSGDDGIMVEAVVPATACADIASVVEACRAAGDGMAARLSVRGMIVELAGREGRRTRVWLARASECGPVGLVSLTQTLAGPRFSIGWLLVHPAWRRRGVGGRLVREAIAAVRHAGGRAVHVETLATWPDAEAFWARVARGGRPRRDE